MSLSPMRVRVPFRIVDDNYSNSVMYTGLSRGGLVGELQEAEYDMGKCEIQIDSGHSLKVVWEWLCSYGC